MARCLASFIVIFDKNKKCGILELLYKELCKIIRILIVGWRVLLI